MPRGPRFTRARFFFFFFFLAAVAAGAFDEAADAVAVPTLVTNSASSTTTKMNLIRRMDSSLRMVWTFVHPQGAVVRPHQGCPLIPDPELRPVLSRWGPASSSGRRRRP